MDLCWDSGKRPLTEGLFHSLTRRDFLRFCLSGFASLALPGFSLPAEEDSQTYGRITTASANVYDQPSLSARKTRTLYQDMRRSAT